jgi:hypothetical protein
VKKASAFEPAIERIAKMLALFMAKRRDWNGELLTIRRSDNDLLTIIADDEDLESKLALHQIFFNK